MGRSCGLTQDRIMIENDLSWDENVKSLVKKAYQRTTMLHYLLEYNPPIEDLLTIYKLYIRSILEQSAVVWNSGLTEENKNNLERVQKTCLKIIYRENYQNYSSVLKTANLMSLSDRRKKLCLKFAKKCVNNEATRDMFPVKKNFTNVNTRYHEKYEVQHALTERFRRSPIIYMQNLLNEEITSILGGFSFRYPT